MQELMCFLRAEEIAGKDIFPESRLIFNAFNTLPLNKIKLVILGQDPYHGVGQAHGFCFSVPRGITIPPSLKNIYKELQRDLNIKTPQHGCLQSWVEQGVLLLNTSLTVEQGKAGSHSKKGWQLFTDKIIQLVSKKQCHVVFLLWGSHAQSKTELIDRSKHLILSSSHPSPLSAYRGFLGNGHFSQANNFLVEHRISPIDWSLPA
ncbi:UNVERIFIED_CONTAM: hypothetical protein GTU68_036603 [Idotea baltica]|nr:hypothetical protein [Idotea baltica]